jgi:two-component system, OmpR family, phosphate regulon sensor histidine kinase PhoR
MTLRSPIFRKLLSIAFLLIAVTLLILDFQMARFTSGRQVESVKQRLTLEGGILSGELAAVPSSGLARWAQEAGGRAQARVTVIDPSGVVRGDSQHDPETMENHANRPEIQEAIRSEVGSSIRHSATLDRDLCYLALRVNYSGAPNWVLRLALPLEDLDAAIAAVRWRLFRASLGAALLALLIAYLFSQSFTRRIAQLRAFAEGLVDARLGASLPGGDDELGALGRALRKTSTELQGLVTSLKVESERREAILASMVEGVLAVDAGLRVTFSNQAFAQAVGALAPVRDRVPLIEVVRDPALTELLTEVLRSGRTLKQRLQLTAVEGRVFEIQAAPLTAPAGPGAIAILHDITDLERLERVRKDFVANVSHELRTPLTAIRGYAETLLEGALDDKENNRRFVEIIKAHAIRLNNIASDLLVLSELESGRHVADPLPISIRDALESALRTVESEARVREVTLRKGRLDDVRVLGDKTRLEQALVNLLDNAVKFNRPGGEVQVECGRPAGGEAFVAIADTGLGIPSDDLSRIFERFYRVDKARSREVGGTGLGLSIVKHVVERMNGAVAVESQLGRGSTFTLRFPAWEGKDRVKG